MQDCVSCQRDLSGSELTQPWEDGDNPYAYVTCRHCGYENLLDGFGADD